MIITVSKLGDVFAQALLNKVYTDKLSVADVSFISIWDDATTITFLADAMNQVLDENTVNKIRIPVLIKLVYIIVRQVYASVNIQGVDIAAVVEFVLLVILDSGFLPLDEFESLIIREVIESSIFLLKTEIPVIKKKWFRFGCF